MRHDQPVHSLTESNTELNADSSLSTRSFAAMSSVKGTCSFGAPFDVPLAVDPEATLGVCKSSIRIPIEFGSEYWKSGWQGTVTRRDTGGDASSAAGYMRDVPDGFSASEVISLGSKLS